MALTYLPFYKEFLRMVKNEYDIDIRLKETPMGKIFPEVRVEEQKVYFNPQLLSLVILYNLSLRYREVSYEPVVLYTLYNIYMFKDEYTHARKILHDLDTTLRKVEETAKDRDKQQVEDATNLQISFILLHETYHILLNQFPKEKEQFLRDASQRVKELRDMLPIGSEEKVLKEMKSLIPRSLPTEERVRLEKELVDKMLKGISEIYDYDKYLNDGENGMLEELSCDLQAWNLIVQQL